MELSREFIKEVVSAFTDGNVVLFRNIGGSDWSELTSPVFDFSTYEYTVTPKSFWLVQKDWAQLYATKEKAQYCLSEHPSYKGGKITRLIEWPIELPIPKIDDCMIGYFCSNSMGASVFIGSDT